MLEISNKPLDLGKCFLGMPMSPDTGRNGPTFTTILHMFLLTDNPKAFVAADQALCHTPTNFQKPTFSKILDPPLVDCVLFGRMIC